MKLVELLAKELSVWPESAYAYAQDADTRAFPWTGTPEFDGGDWIIASGSTIDSGSSKVLYFQLASDYKDAVVTEKQWQAERDRQKGGEWKRHRGGKCPVPVGTKVSTRHRDGKVFDVHFHTATTGSGPATMNAIWKHTGDGNDIMAYKIVSQPQAEDVEVKKFCAGENCNATAENIVHSRECEDEHEASYAGTWQQSSGPLAWRDTILHCQAIIEECEREIQRNVDLLDAEGLMMLADNKKAMQYYVPVTIPHTDWQDGDIVRCVDTELSCADLTIGKEYTVVTRHGELGVIDDVDDHMCSCIECGELEFVRRP